jgi:hypothetical protein
MNERELSQAVRDVNQDDTGSVNLPDLLNVTDDEDQIEQGP